MLARQLSLNSSQLILTIFKVNLSDGKTFLREANERWTKFGGRQATFSISYVDFLA